MAQTDKLNNFMTRCSQQAEQLLADYNILIDTRDEFSKLGITEQALDLVLEETPESDNNHLTGAMVVALMTSIDNLTTYMNAGNGSNLYRMKR